MFSSYLFKHIDNSALIVFRVIFGLLCFLESVGAIFTGWITRTMVDPKFTFTFIGFEWLQPLPDNWMYVYYAFMGVFGLLIMMGYKYRISMIAFTIMWSCTYFMQKASYNNHYYLLILLSAIMVFQPANKYASVDAKLNPNIESNSMPNWCRLVFVFQLLILYTYASIAKMYPDWIDLTVPRLLMAGKINYPIIGTFLQNDFIPYLIAYGGILFDGLIIPLLLYKRTRKYAFFASIFFHLFNAIVFQVGIFPFLSLAFSLFFFDPRTIKNIFLKKKDFHDTAEVTTPSYKTPLLLVLSIYFIVQIALPLRHHIFEDDVLFTEEGHRLSWRMMLRSKQGVASYKIVDKKTKETQNINLDHYLSAKQKRMVSTKPDVIWQFAQHLKQDFKEKGQDISVFVDCQISVNGRPFQKLVDPNVDLADVKWSHFKHSNWLLPSK